MAVISGVARHHRSLDQYVSRLLRDGTPGVVALVDHESDIVIARRQVTRAKRR